MTRKQLSSVLDAILPVLALALGALVAVLAFGGCNPLSDDPGPEDMLDLGDGIEAARGCILHRPDPLQQTCVIHHDDGDDFACDAISYEGDLGCCQGGSDGEGHAALRWFDCDEVVP